MFWMLLPPIFAGLIILLYVALAVVLVLKWLRTRDTGIAWLGIAVVIWPLIVRLLVWGETIEARRLWMHQPVGLFPFSAVERGEVSMGMLFTTLSSLQQLIGVALVLIAVIYLYKGKSESNRIETQVAPTDSEA